jgi:hypothetical protein
VRTLTAVVVLLVAGCAWGGAAARAGVVLPPIDFCKLAAADASTTLTEASPYHVLTSGSFPYWAKSNGCPRYVVDVAVPPWATTPLPTFRLYGLPPAIPDEEAACIHTTVQVTVYRKPVLADSFTSVASGTFVGTWPPSHVACAFVQTAGSPDGWVFDGYTYYDAASAGPAPLGAATYRVTAARRVDTLLGPAWMPVTVVAKGWGTGP